MDDAAPEAPPMSVADWLEAVVGPPDGPPDGLPDGADHATTPGPATVDSSMVAELLVELEAAASDAVAAVQRNASVLDGVLGTATGPIRLSKGRLDHLDRCERSALADARADSVGGDPLALLGGIALDRFVSHQLRAGRVRDPVRDLREHLTAERDETSLELLDAVGEERANDLVAPLATAVAAAWSGVDPAWAPRTQSRATIVLADGGVVCAGVLDVELGGSHTARPGVVVEVKSGRPRSSHVAETYLYALLCTVRDHRPPSFVARWYPGSAPAGLAVTAGVVQAAALRLEHGIRRWGELLAGDPPAERPGPWCSWCPDAEVCPSVDRDPGDLDPAGSDPGDRDPGDRDPGDRDG